MISLLVDESYSFDYLSILDVKLSKLKTIECQDLYCLCYDSMQEQIDEAYGKGIHEKICLSEEYKRLFEANSATFEAVELARYGKIDAHAVDACNMERHKAKVALQEAFFPNQKITEVKT